MQNLLLRKDFYRKQSLDAKHILYKNSVLLLSVRSRLCCALYVDPQVFCGSLLLVLQILFFGVTFCIALLVAFQENREN